MDFSGRAEDVLRGAEGEGGGDGFVGFESGVDLEKHPYHIILAYLSIGAEGRANKHT